MLERIRSLSKERIRPFVPSTVRFRRSGIRTLKGDREARVIPLLIAPGTVVIDGGAHVGGYTNLLSGTVGPAGHVYAFEPIPELAHYLRLAVAKLRLPVTVFEAALADSNGQATLHIPIRGSGIARDSASLKPSSDNSTVRSLTVRTIALDALLTLIPAKVSFVKLDIEGMELAALHGAARLIDQHRPVFMIELDPIVSISQIPEVHDFMHSKDYSAYVFNNFDWVPSERFSTLASIPKNVFFFPSSNTPPHFDQIAHSEMTDK